MEVNRVQKKLRLSKYDAVKYQLMTELVFLKKEYLIPSDLELLTLLAIWGPMELGKFCTAAAKTLYTFTEVEEFSIRAQNVRNRVSKLEKRNFVVKTKSGKKQIELSNSISVFVKGNVLIDYNFLAVESN
jgi:hypothetical protein